MENNKAVLSTTESMDVGIASMEHISVNSNVVPAWTNPNNVVFNVSYGKDWKGDKPMPEGLVVVSKETAEHFESMGIGSIDIEETPAKKKGK